MEKTIRNSELRLVYQGVLQHRVGEPADNKFHSPLSCFMVLRFGGVPRLDIVPTKRNTNTASLLGFELPIV
jgi:hypothetical protein